ncbi:MAG: SH3 domain-containing protein [Anaerolineae bacterium]|nr:SH3 domain-containing protein [Anaerolineae bacterium]
MDRRNLERERLLFRYSAALDRGDFAAVGEVLRAAERDPLLEAMILELNDINSAGGAGPGALVTDTTKERRDMMATALPARPAARSAVNWFSLAAVFLVVIFGALVISRAPLGGGGTSSGTFLGGAAHDLEQQGSVPDCPAVVAAPDGAALRSRPAENAPVVGALADGAAVQVIEVVDSASPAGSIRWAYVTPDDGAAGGQGWANAALLASSTEACALLYAPILVITAAPDDRPESTPPANPQPPPGQTGDSPPALPPGVSATASPLPAQEGPPEGAPPAGSPLDGAPVAVVPPTALPPADGGPPPGADVPPVQTCTAFSAEPLAIYVSAAAETPLFAIEPGTMLSVTRFDPAAERTQISLQIDDILLAGAWVDTPGLNLDDGCTVSIIGAVDGAPVMTATPIS